MNGTWTARGSRRPPGRWRRWFLVALLGSVLSAGAIAASVLIYPTEPSELASGGQHVGRADAGPHAGADARPDGDDYSEPSPTRRAGAAGDVRPRTAPVTSAQAGRILRPDLVPGDEGPDVVVLQKRLRALGFDPGPESGEYGVPTMYAVWAFQKLNGREPDGVVDLDVWRDLAFARPPAPLVADGGPERVEIDLDRQVLYLYEGGELRLVTHVSTGSGRTFCEGGPCRRAVTPTGDYAFTWRATGWRRSPLGLLYNPVYFNGGIAVHGATSVPTHPASHGCVRIPMHIAEYFPSLVERDDPVHVVRSTA